jgi:chromosome segregation ATPase
MSTGASGSRLDAPGPADLLWRERFQHQHAALLERMNSLVSKHAMYDDRTRQAEEAATICNAAATEIERLRARLEAIEEDEDQPKQNQMISEILSQQTRETAILNDRVKGLDGLDLKYRNQEESLGKLQRTLGEYVDVIKDLEAEVKKLHKSGAADSYANGHAIRDLTARFESFEARDEIRDRQLQTAQAKLDALEAYYKIKTAASDSLREPLQKATEPVSTGRFRKRRGQVRQRREVDVR